jgi:hypothetical protein
MYVVKDAQYSAGNFAILLDEGRVAVEIRSGQANSQYGRQSNNLLFRLL